MTKDTEFRPVVGARDWEHADWQDSYYPEDLPREWRLAYYANDFTGVLVPAARWRTVPPQTWRQWYDEVPPHFRFLLEEGPDGAGPPVQLLGEKFGGWVARAGGARAGTTGTLVAAGLHEARNEAAVIVVTARDLGDRRELGRRLVALAARTRPLRALIAADDVPPHLIGELRLLAELAGLA